MKIKEYLCAKYDTDKPTTLLHLEAKFFGIPYPPKNGWIDRYGNREITDYTRSALITGLRKLVDRTDWDHEDYTVKKHRANLALRGIRILEGRENG